jgi:hypothetical protein
MRIAAIAGTESGINVCAPVHHALDPMCSPLQRQRFCVKADSVAPRAQIWSLTRSELTRR